MDDPVGAISVHGVCGALGTVLLGLFHTEEGMLYGGGTGLLTTQLIGVASVFAFCMITGFALFATIRATVGLRVSAEEEIEGLDIAEHGAQAYPDFQGAIGSGGVSEGSGGPAAGVGQPVFAPARIREEPA